MTTEPQPLDPDFIPSPVYCQATVDATTEDHIFKVHVTSKDQKFNGSVYTIRAADEDTAAWMGIEKFVQTHQGIERMVWKAGQQT